MECDQVYAVWWGSSADVSKLDARVAEKELRAVCVVVACARNENELMTHLIAFVGGLCVFERRARAHFGA